MKRKNHVIPYEETRHMKVIDIFIGLAFMFFFISLGVIIAINFRPLYYLSIGWLDIDRISGLDTEVIKQNYNALIDYCSPFYTGSLKFPTLSSSASGLSHFAEVKVIFNAIYIIFGVSAVLCAASVIIKHRHRDYDYLFISAGVSVVVPAIVGIASAANFDFTFELMHKILFRNDDWIFDPAADPVINILPEAYFLECALLIVFVVLAGCLILYLRYRFHRKHKKEERLIPKKMNYYYQ